MRNKRLMALLMTIVMLFMIPVRGVFADTSRNFYASTSSEKYLVDYDSMCYLFTGTKGRCCMEGCATHSEGILSSFYAASGCVTFGEDCWGEVPEDYYWTDLSGVVSMYGTTVQSANMSVEGKYGKDPSVGTSTGTVISSFNIPCSVSVPFESSDSFSMSATALGFWSCNLNICAFSRLTQQETSRIVGSCSFNSAVDLKGLLD